jgi:hypothetical protein
MEASPGTPVTALEGVRKLDTWARAYSRQVSGGLQLSV